jgi:phosphate transport system substrate-binding protein
MPLKPCFPTPGARECLLLAALTPAMFGVGCAKADAPSPSAAVAVTVDGSSTVFPISDAVAAEFQRAQPVKIDVRVPVGVSGTRGGFRKFCAGKADLTGASRPITADESALCAKGGVQYIELPIAYDALAVVVNAKNSWAASITTAELKKLWEPAAQGKVLKWSQVREGWPDQEVHLFGAGLDSGTYDYFTQAVVGQARSSRQDFSPSEDDNVLLEKLAADELGLGFFGFAYVQKSEGRLKALAIDDGNTENGAGPIAPSAEAVRTGTYQPLSRPLLIYVASSALQRKEVTQFVDHYLTKVAKHAERVGYVALPERAYVWAQKRVSAGTTGSIFGAEGSLIGMSIEQLLQKEDPAP